jgi:hypothetical protein
MEVLILVEGPCEEAFVKQVLSPYYDPRGLYFRATVIETKRIISGGSYRGGISNFSQFKRHLVRLLGSAADSKRCTVTTMVDYYRLPTDFPGMESRPNGHARTRVAHVEKAIHASFGAHEAFVPYLSLHEFEALLFTSDEVLPAVLGQREKSADVRKILLECREPELINERPGRGPSARLKELFPAYQKLLHGSLAARQLDFPTVRSRCSHFNAWLKELERRAESRDLI